MLLGKNNGQVNSSKSPEASEINSVTKYVKKLFFFFSTFLFCIVLFFSKFFLYH